MTLNKPKKIIFIGTKNILLKSLSANNETEVMSSISFLPTLTRRFIPDLIVCEEIGSIDILQIRKIDNLMKVPVLIVEESFRELNNLTNIVSFSNVMICNACVALSSDFLGHVDLIMSGKRKLLTAKTSKIIKYTILFINKNFSRITSRALLADHCNVAEDYLSRIFKKEMGVSLWTYLTQVRLYNANSLLMYTGLQVKEIASECGFGSSSYFINTYRKFFSSSPNDVRK